MTQEQEHFQSTFALPQQKDSLDVLPEEAFHEAHRYRLGSPLKRYVDSNPWSSQSITLIATGFLCSTITTFLLIIIFVTSYPNAFAFISYMLFLAGTPLVLTTWGIIAVRGQAGRRGYLCTEGFLILTGSNQTKAAIRIGSNRVRAAIRWDDIAEVRMQWSFGMSTEHPEDTEQWQVGMRWRIITKENRSVVISSGYAEPGMKRPTEMEQLGFEICQIFRERHPQYTTRRKHATVIYSA